jgi:hypothetical protein
MRAVLVSPETVIEDADAVVMAEGSIESADKGEAPSDPPGSQDHGTFHQGFLGTREILMSPPETSGGSPLDQPPRLAAVLACRGS